MGVRRPAWGWAVVTAATGTVLIGIGAFWLSFMALADLAAAPGQAWTALGCARDAALGRLPRRRLLVHDPH